MSDSVSLLTATPPANPTTHPVVDDALRAKLSAKTEALQQVLARIATDFAPAAFASSLSAEDMVLFDLIARQQLPIRVFTLDTGRLPAETYTLLSDIEARYPNLPIEVRFPRHEAVEALVARDGINGFYQSVDARKACCAVRKVEVLDRALAGARAWITGMRAQQSATRSNLPLQEYDAAHQAEKFSPLTDWTEKEVWAYIRLHGVPYNQLHDRFFPSIGCAPCTRAISPGEDIRAGRWWWENPESKECGLHVKKLPA